MIDDLSVVITSFKRAWYLDRAIKSVKSAGITNIVVATDEPDEAVMDVLKRHEVSIVSSVDDDTGCASLWLRAAYHSPTDRLIVLHDDDTICPEFGQVYQTLIKPAMDSGSVEFCSWRAHLLMDDGKTRPTEWFQGPTRALNSGALRDFLLQRGRLSLSPIVSILDRSTLIGAIKEAHQYLQKHEACLLHQGMTIGDEIIAYLKHCDKFAKWFYIDKVLSMYGCCESSGTVKAQKSKDLKQLTTGYDIARDYFRKGYYLDAVHEPRIIFVYDDFQPSDEDDQRRFDYAMWTWKFHFSQGDMIEFPTRVTQWDRSSADLGDPKPVPFFKDLVNHGMSRARPEDVVVYCNRDAFLTTKMPERVMSAVRKHGIALGWRRNLVPKPGRLYKNVCNARRDGGIDIVAMTPDWWEKHRDLYPDMLIGREAYDWVLRIMAEELHGKGVYMDNVIGHEPHAGQFWKNNRKSNPGQTHNRGLAKVFFARRKDRRALVSLL